MFKPLYKASNDAYTPVLTRLSLAPDMADTYEVVARFLDERLCQEVACTLNQAAERSKSLMEDSGVQ